MAKKIKTSRKFWSSIPIITKPSFGKIKAWPKNNRLKSLLLALLFLFIIALCGLVYQVYKYASAPVDAEASEQSYRPGKYINAQNVRCEIDKTAYVIKKSGVGLRKEGSEEAKVLNEIKFGQKVNIGCILEGWRLVSHDGVIGFVRPEHLGDKSKAAAGSSAVSGSSNSGTSSKTAAKPPSKPKPPDKPPAQSGHISSVEAVSVTPPSSIACSQTFTFKARVTVDGPAVVVYYWQSRDGDGNPETLTFSGSGTQTKEITKLITVSQTTLDNWMRVVTISPDQFTSGQLSYSFVRFCL